jgi:glycosyltransferase involved in cell wall biosynthesis
MTLFVSVVIPTHNPRRDFMERVIGALRGQTLPNSQWELVLVDNASNEPLADQYDLSWHPSAQHLRENKLGLTPARLAGISRSSGEIVVFVDDDNVLYPDYLEKSARLADDFPFIGIWGGQVFPEFEEPDNFYARNFAAMFTARSFTSNKWTNRKRDYEIMPIGAGLCVRRNVLRKYGEICARDPRRQMLDRTGDRLLTCGDLDMVFTACDLGYGKGLFHELKLTHLIPKKRLCEEFVVGNAEGNQYSAAIQNFLIDGSLPDSPRRFTQRLGRLYRLASKSSLDRKIQLAEERGQRLAVRDMTKWGWIGPNNA